MSRYDPGLGVPAPEFRTEVQRVSREADLNVFAKFGDDNLKGCLEAEAFSRREIGGEDDALDLLVGDAVDVEVTWQPSS